MLLFTDLMLVQEFCLLLSYPVDVFDIYEFFDLRFFSDLIVLHDSAKCCSPVPDIACIAAIATELMGNYLLISLSASLLQIVLGRLGICPCVCV